MNYDVLNFGKGFAKAWTRGVEIEETALKQIENCAAMPFIHKHIAVMPDVHGGYGATVGSVIPTKGAIIPAAVGVDIGCGMMAAKLNLTASDLPDNLSGIRSAIEAAVPHGRTDNAGKNDKGAWADIPEDVAHNWLRLSDDDRWFRLEEKHPKLFRGHVNTDRHLGTLGTGNHFIELCLDESQNVWLMLHSGSRGIGNRIGTYFIELAKEDMRKWLINLPEADLSYFPEGTDHFDDYVSAVGWAQDYARTNREVMFGAAVAAIRHELGKLINWSEHAVNCHHNYVERENHFGANVWVTRKGAVRAREGDLGIIPGSMGAKSFIVRGKGNKDSFCSCSHGAGRRMSRTKARHTFTIDDHIKATKGVECRKDIEVIDETPAAYKDIDAVMAAQTDLVEIVHTLKQIVCVKG
jgi:tRNA-splicing ligase RtcB